MILAEGTVIGLQWKIGELVGEGACGRVYAVTCTNPANVCSFPLVAKVIPTPIGTGKAANAQKVICDTLNYEYTLFFGHLSTFTYRPNIPDVRLFHGIDKVHNVRYMVMERFERDLVGYAIAAKPDHRAVANIGLQILEGLEWMHNKGMLFIDVKPDNFMLNGDRIKFVDYGLVERWLGHSGPRVAATRSTMAGTPSYASIDVHQCSTPTRKDDIESLGLVLISLFMEGQLPWSDARSDADCKSRKMACNIVDLALQNNCPEVGEMVMLCRGLEFTQKPDYEGYRRLLGRMRDREVSTGASSSGPSGRRSLPSSSVTTKAVHTVENIAAAVAGSSTGSSTAARNATKRRTEETESNEASTQSGVEKPVRGVRNVSRPGTQRPAVIDDNIETSPKQTDQRRKLKRSANTALDSDSAIQVEVEAQGPFSRTKETAKRRKGEAIEGEIEGDGAKMLLDKTRDGGNRRESKESQTLKSRGRNTGEKDTFDGNATDSGTHTTIPNTMKSKFNKTSTNTDTPMLPNTTVNNTSNTYTHAHSNNNNNSDSDVAEPVLMSPLRRSGRNVKVAAPSPLITRRGLKITDLPSKKETVKKAKAKATATSSSDSERSGVAKKNVKQFNIVVVEGPEENGRVINMDPEPVTEFDGKIFQKIIGRTEARKVSDIVLGKDKFISESHLTVIWKWTSDGECIVDIWDRSSTHGVELNGSRIEAGVWKRAFHGNTIKIGSTVLRIDYN